MPASTQAPLEMLSSGFSQHFNISSPLPKNSTRSSFTFLIREDPPAKRTASISSFVHFASSIARFKGGVILSNKCLHFSSKSALVISYSKSPSSSAPPNRALTSMWYSLESVREFFASRHAWTRRSFAFLPLLENQSNSDLSSLILSMQTCRIASSKSAPPRWTSPAVEIVSMLFPLIFRTEISNVPPPKSKTRHIYSSSFPSAFLYKPYERAAAVGSLRNFFTSRPAILAASLVACFYRSLK